MNPESKQLTWSKWKAKYKPIDNHICEDPEEKLFEADGEELAFVESKDPQNIWTWVEGDMSTLLCAGIGFEDPIGYYICETPWKDEWEYVVVTVDTQCHCYKDSGYNGGDNGDPNCETCEGSGYKTSYLE
jgi:hypothetical protein